MNALIIVAAVLGLYMLVAAILCCRDLQHRDGDAVAYAANRRRSARRRRSAMR